MATCKPLMLPCMFSVFTFCHKSYSIICLWSLGGYLFVILIPAARLGRTKKVVKYIDYLMLEVREMREENGFICLKVLQLWFFVLLLVSKNYSLYKTVACLKLKPYAATWNIITIIILITCNTHYFDVSFSGANSQLTYFISVY